MNWALVDDKDPGLSYSSGWALRTGSTRQWDGAVHSTSQQGATVTLKFRGSQVKVFVTLPVGPGVVQSQYTIDGGAPTTVNRQSPSSSAEYSHLFFEKGGLRDGEHTLVIANVGTGADLQLDKIEWYPSEDPGSDRPLPIAAPPNPQPTPNTPSTPSTPSQPQQPPQDQTPPQPQPQQSQPPPANIITTVVTDTQTQVLEIPAPPSVHTTVVSGRVVTYTTSGTGTTITRGLPSGTTGASTVLVTATDANGSTTIRTVVNVAQGPTRDSTGTNQGTMVVKVDSPGTTLSAGGRGGGDGSGSGSSPTGGLGKGALAGIVAGTLIVLFILLLLSLLFFRRYRKRRRLMDDARVETAFGTTARSGQMEEVRSTDRTRIAPFEDAAPPQSTSIFAGMAIRKAQLDTDLGPFRRLDDPDGQNPTSPSSSSLTYADDPVFLSLTESATATNPFNGDLPPPSYEIASQVAGPSGFARGPESSLTDSKSAQSYGAREY